MTWWALLLWFLFAICALPFATAILIVLIGCVAVIIICFFDLFRWKR
jgi:hypothetical protein